MVACWNAFAESHETEACDAIDAEAPLLVDGEEVDQFGGDVDADQTWVCDHTDDLANAGFSEDDVAVVEELFGCGLFDILNVWWQTPVSAGADLCLYYVPAKAGFGFPNDARSAVVVESCSLSVVE
jgi:hypothetical protein